MDPDRFQMKELKRRMNNMEKAMERANTRIRILQKQHVKTTLFLEARGLKL